MCGIVIIIVLFSVVEAYVATGTDEPAARFAYNEVDLPSGETDVTQPVQKKKTLGDRLLSILSCFTCGAKRHTSDDKD